ncbi:MAG TPA: hypothetical protein PKX40_10830 [Spirochaetota bacterium]|nr:hypothetical protein [Spirochaetota bacterium]
MKTIPLIILSVLIILQFLSCSENERRIGLSGQTSTVILAIGNAAEHTAQNEPLNILDRILHLFESNAIAQTAPAAFSSVKVRVTGPDIGLIEKDFNPYGTISLTVPSGSLRQFEVIAYVAPGDLSAASSFRGTAVANLPAGETVTVPVPMGLYETKIVVPDSGNNRLVILDTMSSWRAQLTTLTADGQDSISLTGPRDVDFDSRGRIYIAYEFAIVRCDNIAGENYRFIYNVSSPVAVAVDRANNIVYLATGTALYRTTLDGTALPALSAAGINNISGMDVAADGTLIITGFNISYFNAVFRYDPEANGGSGAIVNELIYQDSDILLTSVTDVQVKPSGIYVLQPQDAGDNRILRLAVNPDSTLRVAAHGTDPLFGTLSNAGHFTSINNSGFFILEKPYSPVNSRLIYIRDISGFGWSEITGSGSDLFNFFDYGGGG